MATAMSAFNHTAQKLLSGDWNDGDTWKVALYTNNTGVDLTETTKAQVDATATEVANGNGYTTGGGTLANFLASTVTTNDAKLDADDFTWNASGGSIAAAYALIYDDTTASDEVAFWLDLDGTQTASDGTPFIVRFNSAGIATLTV
ncbi:MAG: hypothetical protein QNJ16_21865 [Rhodobacter sp.]|nr:hypothetical protein [Rhodobacter sp.]